MKKLVLTTVSFLLMLQSLIFLFVRDAAANGLGVTLDGVNDRAQAVNSIFPDSSTLQSFTIEGWIYPRSAGRFIATDDAYDLILFSQPGAANGGVGIKFTLWSGSSGSQSITEFRDVSLNEWNHIAVMFDAASLQMNIAINGILSSSPSMFDGSDLYVDSNQQFVLGAVTPTAGGLYNGYMDEVRVSDIVRYTSDFTPLNTLNVDAHTRALFHFNESAGSSIFADASGNGNTLSGVNGAQTATIDRMEGIVGDYNDNGIVDAADYTVWRNSLGQTGSGLAADGNGDNMVDGGDYDVWKMHFGETAGIGSAGASPSHVPEPASATLLLLAALRLVTIRRGRC